MLYILYTCEQGQTDTKIFLIYGKNIKRNSCVPGGIVSRIIRTPICIGMYIPIVFIYIYIMLTVRMISRPSGTDRNICHASDAGGTRDYCP